MPLLTLLNDSGGGGTGSSTNYALLLALTSGGTSVGGSTNYNLLLALTSESGSPIVPPAPKVGGFPAKRRQTQTLAEFEAAKAKPFGRNWYADFKAAELAAKQAAQEAPRKAAQKALRRAAEAAGRVADELGAADARPDLSALTAALETASGTRKLEETIRASKRAVEVAARVMAEIRRIEDEADEDEAITLLMMH